MTVGSTVTVQEDVFDPETYYVVGAKEADPRNGKISNESPIGKALMDHKVGDVVEAETPGGTLKIKILGSSVRRASKLPLFTRDCKSLANTP